MLNSFFGRNNPSDGYDKEKPLQQGSPAQAAASSSRCPKPFNSLVTLSYAENRPPCQNHTKNFSKKKFCGSEYLPKQKILSRRIIDTNGSKDFYISKEGSYLLQVNSTRMRT